MEAEKSIIVKTVVHVIDGVRYRVTAEFKGEVDLRHTVYECALKKVLEEIKKSA